MRFHSLRPALAALLLAPALSMAQSVGFTFDDGLDPGWHPDVPQWNAQILRALEKEGVKATFFPAGRFVDSPGGLALVKAWGTAGHAIGNHTYSHADIDAMTVEEYTADIARGDALFRPMPNFQPRLRFPFLKEGATAAKRDGVRGWLAKNGYASGPVSIVTSDWYFNQRFNAWIATHAGGDAEPFRKAYVKHVIDTAAYADALARDTLGRSPAHVMLLHANRINALYLADVLAALRVKGWKFVSADTAFADPLYKQLPRGLPAGNGILSELTKDAGRPVPSSGNEDHGKAILDALGY